MTPKLARILAEVGLDPTPVDGVLFFDDEEDRDAVLEAAENCGLKVTAVGTAGLKEDAE